MKENYPRITNKKIECGAVLFHSTTKKNLKNIMKEGIKPGAGEGWCKLAVNAGIISSIKMKEMEKECKENTFLSGSLEFLERMDLEPMDIDTIAILCLPQEKLYIDNKPFKEWDKDRFTKLPIGDQRLSQLSEIKVKETIPPENIIGCLDIKKFAFIQNRARYLINKNCDS
jgi:hypothetical protein